MEASPTAEDVTGAVAPRAFQVACDADKRDTLVAYNISGSKRTIGRPNGSFKYLHTTTAERGLAVLVVGDMTVCVCVSE